MHNHEVEALAEHLGDLTALVDALSDDDFSRPTRCPGRRELEPDDHARLGALAPRFPLLR